MGRFTKPRAKVCRRLGVMLFDNSNVEKAFLKREAEPFGRRKQSEYGVRLKEKQKVMHYYGMREKQMSKLFQRARAMKGDAGQNFLILCERRLDNAVHAAGFAQSRAAARQLVAHGHVRVNGRKMDAASHLAESGDAITVKESPKIHKLVDGVIERKSGYSPPDWLAVDPQTRTAKVVRLPLREDCMLPVNEQLVVEFYSR